MNILFIGMNFYNYDIKISDELCLMGHNVTHITDAPDKYIFPARFTSHSMLEKEWKRHQNEELNKIKDKNFDLIFVTVGRHLCTQTLDEIKFRNPKARFILYLWDDVARVENFNKVKNYYDLIFSIDPSDCLKYSFIFLPLFFTNEFYNEKGVDIKYDIYSAMASHSDRIDIIKKICRDDPAARYLFYIFVSKPEYIKTKIESRKDSRINYIIRPVPKDQNRKYLISSKALLDIPYIGQQGLTIRTFECIKCGIKLITTNSSIKYYDFYNDDSIYILNRKNPFINRNFFDIPFHISEELIEKYSLHNWLKTIIEEKQENFLKKGFQLKDIVNN